MEEKIVTEWTRRDVLLYISELLPLDASEILHESRRIGLVSVVFRFYFANNSNKWCEQ